MVVGAIPRAKVKRLVHKKEGNIKIKSGIDILLYLNYCLFIKRLLREAEIDAKEGRESKLTGKHIRAAKAAVLRQFRG